MSAANDVTAFEIRLFFSASGAHSSVKLAVTVSEAKCCQISNTIAIMPSQGFWGTGEKGHLFQGNKGKILRGTGEQRQNFEGNRGTKTILGNR